MELITGIDWHEGSPTAHAVVSWSKCINISIEDLPSRGLPVLDQVARIVTIDLSNCQTATFEEYAFAFNRPYAQTSRHSTWSILNARTRLVIPALVFLRAFIRPGRVLMPQLFKPQSLDDVCVFARNEGEYFVRSLSPLGDVRKTRDSTIMAPLSWFYCFPSARRAWASVYQAAKEGRLHFELPKASITVSMRGMRVGSTVYATQLSLLKIEAHEEPIEFGVGHPQVIEASAHSRAGKRDPQCSSLGKEYQKLTDAEWEVVRPLLASPKGKIPVDNRTLLDCILQKPYTSMTWDEVAALNNVPVPRVTTAQRRWKTDTRLNSVMERLNEMRNATP